MRIVIPTKQGRIAPRLEEAEQFALFEIDGCMLLGQSAFAPAADVAAELCRRGANLVICGRMRRQTAIVLRRARVEIILGAAGDAGGVLLRYLSGESVGEEELD